MHLRLIKIHIRNLYIDAYNSGHHTSDLDEIFQKVFNVHFEHSLMNFPNYHFNCLEVNVIKLSILMIKFKLNLKNTHTHMWPSAVRAYGSHRNAAIAHDAIVL